MDCPLYYTLWKRRWGSCSRGSWSWCWSTSQPFLSKASHSVTVLAVGLQVNIGWNKEIGLLLWRLACLVCTKRGTRQQEHAFSCFFIKPWLWKQQSRCTRPSQAPPDPFQAGKIHLAQLPQTQVLVSSYKGAGRTFGPWCNSCSRDLLVSISNCRHLSLLKNAICRSTLIQKKMKRNLNQCHRSKAQSWAWGRMLRSTVLRFWIVNS